MALNKKILAKMTQQQIFDLLRDYQIKEKKWKEREQELIDQEENYRLLYENAPLGYQSLDEEGNIIEVNKAWLDILGYKKEDVIGKNFADFLPKEFHEHFKKNFPQFKSMGYILGVEFEMIKSDGNDVIVSFDGKIGKTKENKFIRTHCILRDITEKKKSQDYIHKKNDQIESYHKAIIDISTDDDVNSGNFYQAAQKICKKATELMDIEYSSIWFFNKDNSELRMLTRHKRSENSFDKDFVISRKNYPEYFSAIEKERIVIAHSNSDDEISREFLHNYFKPNDLHSMLDATIRSGTDIIGVICFEQSGFDKDWNDADIMFSVELADQAAQASAISQKVKALENLEKSRDELQESQATIEGILNAAPIGIGIVKDRMLGWTNRFFKEFTGYTDEELNGKSARIIYPDEEEYNRVAEIKHPKVERFGYGDVETKIQRKNGEIKNVIMSSAQIARGDSSKGLIFTVYDITDFANTRKALEKSEEEKDLILSTVTESVIYLDTDMNIIWANKAAEKLSGKNYEENKNIKCYQYWYGQNEKCMNCHIETAIESGVLSRAERLTSDGKFYDIKAIPVFNKNGEVSGAIETVSDISDIKTLSIKFDRELKINQALADVSAKLLEPVLEFEDYAEIILDEALKLTASPHGFISAIDESNGSNILYAMTDMFDQFSGMKNEDGYIVMKPDENGFYPGFIGHVLNTGEPMFTNNPHNPDDQSPECLLNVQRCVCVPAKYGETILGQIAVFNSARDYKSEEMHIVQKIANLYASMLKRVMAENDLKNLNRELEKRVAQRTEKLNDAVEYLRIEVEERHQIQQELMIAKDKISETLENEKEVNKMKTRFISMVSHEYRTPLTVILSSSHLIGRYSTGEHKEKIDKHLRKIQNSVSQMTKLIDDVLIVGKSEGRSFTVNSSIIDIVSLLKEIYEESKVIDSGKHSIEFSCDTPKMNFFTDRAILKQILTNLISNALKYSPNSKIVKLTMEHNEKEVVIKVKDQGNGIAQQELNQLFEPFFRNPGYIGNIPGIGLGLAIVKRGATALGGKIEVESIPDKGTEFILTLPVKKIDAIKK